MREQRKVVTILFADVVGSTALATQSDPEVVRATMARYFQRITEVSEAYGGSVEKFAGDAAMVVFGVPTVHDDDAERAVRAALEIRDGAAELVVRVGVNTGEAVTAAREDRQFMVSGDAVNVAARLQQGAEPSEVLVGPLTEQLTRKVIEYASREPVAAKGKPEPLVAFRALRARTQVPEQARGVPGLHAVLVGRDRELRLLLDTFARTSDDRRPHLFTLVGSAGVGKSRLVKEALSALASSGARVVRGRCLPYGRGITYWPLIEILRQDTGITLSDERDIALLKLDRWLGELLHEDSQRPAIRARLSVMLGFEAPESVMPDTPAERVERELAWGFRRYLDALAKEAPLIVVVDDLQWAEPPVVAMIEQLVERVEAAPMLVIGIARPEFLEHQRAWSSGKPNSTTITLDPLSPHDTGTLIALLLEIEALPDGLRAQIIEQSAGTPLFCEEFIHMLIDEGRLVREGTSWRATGAIEQIRVPQTINAVLTARLDGLPDREKALLQAASVIGQRFQLNQIQELAPGSDLDEVIDSLRRKGLLIGGDGPDDELAFRHLLIRDAAYGSLPKSERAALHDRFGTLLEQQVGDPQQLTEILAHHAEQAFALSSELGLSGDVLLRRGRRALDWSIAMGDRARTRHEVLTLESALKTVRAAAAALPNEGGPQAMARLRLLEAQLLVMKADYSEAGKAAAEAATLAQEAGLLPLVATARLTEAWIYNWSGEGSVEDFARIVELAVDACRKAGDLPGEIEARQIGANIPFALGRLAEFIEISARLVEQARAIGDPAHEAAITERLAIVEHVRGNRGLSERYQLQAEGLAMRYGFRNVALRLLMDRGTKRMRDGDLTSAEDTFRAFLLAAREAGAVQSHISALRFLSYTLLYRGGYAEAAQALDQALELSEISGERWNRSELFALRARTSLELGDLESADRFIDHALASVRTHDITGISEVQHHLGLIRAAQGRHAEAEAALRLCLNVIAGTEYNAIKGTVAFALAKFLADRGRLDEAKALSDEYVELVHEWGWRLWDPEISTILSLIAAGQRT
ncbi:MAG TPA: AAA family ATPase [Candidatus Dormibacteraeota bacterium]|nr:AAA family ATPase [Candidatus Dormibacteraeota bacterium]